MNKKEEIDFTDVVYLIDDKNICFATEEAVKTYFDKLWHVHASMTHTGRIFVSGEHTSTPDLTVLVYECARRRAIFTRRVIVKTPEQIEKCMKSGYLNDGSMFKIGKIDTSVIMRAVADYPHRESALTLDPKELGKNDSGWTISGEINEDYYEWVNKFEAEHPVYGKVYGDFEKEVNADSVETFWQFWKDHQPQAWDYMDI